MWADDGEQKANGGERRADERKQRVGRRERREWRADKETGAEQGSNGGQTRGGRTRGGGLRAVDEGAELRWGSRRMTWQTTGRAGRTEEQRRTRKGRWGAGWWGGRQGTGPDGRK